MLPEAATVFCGRKSGLVGSCRRTFTEESFMKEVTLIVPAGEVATIAIVPEFEPMPEVLVWGVRIFKRLDDHTYVECFWVAVVETRQPKP